MSIGQVQYMFIQGASIEQRWLADLNVVYLVNYKTEFKLDSLLDGQPV